VCKTVACPKLLHVIPMNRDSTGSDKSDLCD
jgi:hypothetical protein